MNFYYYYYYYIHALDPVFLELYKTKTVEYRKEVDKVKKSYYDNIISNSCNKSKTVWTIIKEITEKDYCGTNSLSTRDHRGSLYNDAMGVAELLLVHFIIDTDFEPKYTNSGNSSQASFYLMPH